jgi:hypothetical protein
LTVPGGFVGSGFFAIPTLWAVSRLRSTALGTPRQLLRASSWVPSPSAAASSAWWTHPPPMIEGKPVEADGMLDYE